MSVAMGALVDVNVLVALMHARHVHSPLAVRWLAGRDEPDAVVVCRVAQMGALRILTHPSAMKEEVKSASEFWGGWQRLLEDGRFALSSEPAGLEDVWRALSASLPKGTPAETDCYLAAFAIAGAHSLVSFDRGMRRFKGLDVVTPS
jgi:toxin-antitoxin system PIN domain toxin